MSEVQRPMFQYLDKSEGAKWNKNFVNSTPESYVMVGKKKYFFPSRYVKDFEIYYNFEAEPSDSWIFAFPRSGSTWTQELVWLIRNDLDFQTANEVLLDYRVVTLEVSLWSDILINGKKSYEHLQDMKRPRVIKTHFPLEYVPSVLKSNAKVVYVARNPKDTIVSMYYYCRERAGLFEGSFEQFYDYFERGLVVWSRYWEHLKESWNLRHNPNVLFLFYEDLKHDLISQAKRVAEFFNKSYSDVQYEELARYLNFDNFKNNKMANTSFYMEEPTTNQMNAGHIRKGKTQNWHELFTPDLNDRANKWIKENLKDSDICFPHVDIYA